MILWVCGFSQGLALAPVLAPPKFKPLTLNPGKPNTLKTQQNKKTLVGFSRSIYQRLLMFLPGNDLRTLEAILLFK